MNTLFSGFRVRPSGVADIVETILPVTEVVRRMRAAATHRKGGEYMSFKTIRVLFGLLAILCVGPVALAQTPKHTTVKHSAAWYKKHRKHSAAWYKKHSKHSAAWYKKHSRHSAAWY